MDYNVSFPLQIYRDDIHSALELYTNDIFMNSIAADTDHCLVYELHTFHATIMPVASVCVTNTIFCYSNNQTV